MADQVHGASPSVTDQLLGLLACGEVFGFNTLADASAMSAKFDHRVALMNMAVAHRDAYLTTKQRLTDSGADADAIIGAFTGPLAIYHDRTAPSDEQEALLKSYVGTGIAADFIREVAGYLDPDTQAFVAEVLAEPNPDAVVVPHLNSELAQDPEAAGKLALWGRRLMGEAISQAQRVATDRPELVALLVGEDDLAGFQQMIARMTSRHSARMKAIGLYP